MVVILQLNKEEAEEYLQDRRRKGFNAILTNLTWRFYADNPPSNKYGDVPFATTWDFSTPNELYFAHADWVIRKAKENGNLSSIWPRKSTIQHAEVRPRYEVRKAEKALPSFLKCHWLTFPKEYPNGQ